MLEIRDLEGEYLLVLARLQLVTGLMLILRMPQVGDSCCVSVL